MTKSKSSANVLCLNPPGFVPLFGQGLYAKESQLGSVGTKNWLKTIKLHKYWPLVSHWSYWQMISLTESNIDHQIKLIGGTGMTQGAQGKFLRCIQELSERQVRLLNTIAYLESNRISLPQALAYISRVIKTPMPTSEAEHLPTVVVYAVFKALEHAWYTGIFTHEEEIMKDILCNIKTNPILAAAAVRLEGNTRHFSSLWKKHAELTFMLATGITNQPSMNCSVNSGFNDSSRFNRSDVFSIWPLGINEVMICAGDDSCYKPTPKDCPIYRTFTPNNISKDKYSFKYSFASSDDFSIRSQDSNEMMYGLDDSCYKPTLKDNPVNRTFTPSNLSEDIYSFRSSFTHSNDFSVRSQDSNEMMYGLDDSCYKPTLLDNPVNRTFTPSNLSEDKYSFRSSFTHSNDFSVRSQDSNEMMYGLDDSCYKPTPKDNPVNRTFTPSNLSEDKYSFRSSFTHSNDFSVRSQDSNEMMFSLGDNTCYKPTSKDSPVYRPFKPNSLSKDKDSFKSSFIPSEDFTIRSQDSNGMMFGLGDDICYKPTPKDNPVNRTFTPSNLSEDKYSFRSSFTHSNDFSVRSQDSNEMMFSLGDNTCYKPTSKDSPVYRPFKPNSLSKDKDSFKSSFIPSEDFTIRSQDSNGMMFGLGDDICYKPTPKDRPVYRTYPNNLSDDKDSFKSSFMPSDDFSSWSQGSNEMMYGLHDSCYKPTPQDSPVYRTFTPNSLSKDKDSFKSSFIPSEDFTIRSQDSNEMMFGFGYNKCYKPTSNEHPGHGTLTPKNISEDPDSFRSSFTPLDDFSIRSRCNTKMMYALDDSCYKPYPKDSSVQRTFTTNSISKEKNSFKSSSVHSEDFSMWPRGNNEMMFGLGDDSCYKPTPKNCPEDKDAFKSSLTPSDDFSIWPCGVNGMMYGLGDERCYKPTLKDRLVYKTFTHNTSSEGIDLDTKIEEIGNYLSRNLDL